MNTSVNPLRNLPVRILAAVFTIIFIMILRSPVAIAGAGPDESAPSTTSTESTMYFNGNLFTETGEAYPDGFYKMSFTFYDASVGGEKLWSETQTIQLDHGNFSVRLGKNTPMNLTFTSSLWLEVRAVGFDEIRPSRTEFLIPDAELDLR